MNETRWGKPRDWLLGLALWVLFALVGGALILATGGHLR